MLKHNLGISRYLFASGAASCWFSEGMSCAGEYNLRLGILKELHPEIIATHQGRRSFNTQQTPGHVSWPSQSAKLEALADKITEQSVAALHRL